jgi:uncharacterized Zn finger protein
MQIKQNIRCPNCGSEAERYHVLSSQLTRTQCHSCDYLMVMCSRTGKVIEAYAPGLDFKPTKAIVASPVVDHKQHLLPIPASNVH